MCFYCKLQRELATCYKIRLSFIFGIFIYVNKKLKISKKNQNTEILEQFTIQYFADRQ